MPQFSYVFKDKDGKTFSEIAEAFNRTGLIETLQKQGYFIIRVQEVSSASKQNAKKAFASKSYSHKKVNLNDLVVFARQLATMVEAGVSLTKSLTVVAEQTDSKEFNRVITNVKDDVERGNSLRAALAKYPNVFDQFWVSLVEVGEASGTMPKVLEKLAFYLEQQTAFQSSIQSALIYPSILISVVVVAILVFALLVGPRFEDIFTSMKVELPALTKYLLMSFRFIKAHFLLMAGSIAILVYLFKKYTRTYQGKILLEKFLFGLPSLGEIYKLIIMERFSSQLALLVDSGVPILHALDISQRLVNNHTCAIIIGEVKEGVRQGETMVKPMEHSGFFPPMAVQMISVGEETGELSKMLKHVADFYLKTVETFMKRFGTIIEPFMLVFIAVVVGVILAAMFLPMFNLSSLGRGAMNQ